jgi:hypothetical protein
MNLHALKLHLENQLALLTQEFATATSDKYILEPFAGTGQIVKHLPTMTELFEQYSIIHFNLTASCLQ